MSCFYCDSKDDSMLIAGKKACKLCYHDFYFDPEIDYDDGEEE
jgi:hypothetical protein